MNYFNAWGNEYKVQNKRCFRRPIGSGKYAEWELVCKSAAIAAVWRTYSRDQAGPKLEMDPVTAGVIDLLNGCEQ